LIANYTQTASSTTIPFQLASNQSVIVAFDLTSSAVNVSASKAEEAYNVKDLSQYLPASSAGQAVDLTEWTVVIEHWNAPRDLSRMLPSDTVKHNTTHTVLKPGRTSTAACSQQVG
jgi:hypothetical protein